MLLCQDKDRGIVIIDRNKHTNKCLNILNTEQFRKLNRDPTKPIEAKIQRAVRKIKSHLIKLAQHLENFMGRPRNIKYLLMKPLMIFHYVQLYPS